LDLPKATSSSTRSEGQIDRRSRIETFFDVLCTIGSGIEKPTHIMYASNLSWTVMQAYTSMLVSKGLAIYTESEGKRRYKLSEKGKRIMRQYLSLKEDLDIISEKTS
jgi:predicted transcriptional regulator